MIPYKLNMIHYKKFVRKMTASQGKALRDLVYFLNDLKVNHRVERIVMNRLYFSDKQYQVEFFRKEVL